MHIASAWGKLALLQLLLASGGNPITQDNEGLTPLDYATKEEHWHIVELLQDAARSATPELSDDISDNECSLELGVYYCSMYKVVSIRYLDIFT